MQNVFSNFNPFRSPVVKGTEPNRNEEDLNISSDSMQRRHKGKIDPYDLGDESNAAGMSPRPRTAAGNEVIHDSTGWMDVFQDGIDHLQRKEMAAQSLRRLRVAPGPDVPAKLL